MNASAMRRLAVTLAAASVISSALATVAPDVAVQEEAPEKMVPEFKHTFHVHTIPMPALRWYKRPLTLTLPKVVFPQPGTLRKTITIERRQPVIVRVPAPVDAEAPAYGAPLELPEAGYDSESVPEVSASSDTALSPPETVASEGIAAPEPAPEYTDEFPQVNDSSFQ